MDEEEGEGSKGGLVLYLVKLIEINFGLLDIFFRPTEDEKMTNVSFPVSGVPTSSDLRPSFPTRSMKDPVSSVRRKWEPLLRKLDHYLYTGTGSLD